MPAHLWDEAVGLARRLGLSPVKAALGLNYESLKERLEESGDRREAPSARFIEVSGAQLVPAAGPVIELANADGMRLTVRLAAGSALDIAEVVRAFRRT